MKKSIKLKNQSSLVKKGKCFLSDPAVLPFAFRFAQDSKSMPVGRMTDDNTGTTNSAGETQKDD